MYPISSMIGVRPVLMSNDHRPGAALDNRNEGGFPIWKNQHIRRRPRQFFSSKSQRRET